MSLTDTLKDMARPFLDPEDGTHPGISNEDMADIIDIHAGSLDRLGMHGPAHDIRAAAVRLREKGK